MREPAFCSLNRVIYGSFLAGAFCRLACVRRSLMRQGVVKGGGHQVEHGIARARCMKSSKVATVTGL